MIRKMILVTFFGLLVGGCASDPKIDTTSSGGSTPAKGDVAMTDPSPSTSTAAATDSTSTNQNTANRNRIAAGVQEETLDTCLAHIPNDATTGQRMLAEQTCRRDFAPRR